jgi:hypothetical protein
MVEQADRVPIAVAKRLPPEARSAEPQRFCASVTAQRNQFSPLQRQMLDLWL